MLEGTLLILNEKNVFKFLRNNFDSINNRVVRIKLCHLSNTWVVFEFLLSGLIIIHVMFGLLKLDDYL